MLRKIGLLLIILSTQACGIINGHYQMRDGAREYNSTDPIFRGYIASFESDYRQATQNSQFTYGDIPINFGDTQGYEGLCVKYTNGQAEIFMKRSWWDSASQTQKEVLLYHEMGHCRLDRRHDESTYNQYKTSIMHSTVPDSYTYNKYRSQYLMELFTNNKSYLMDALTI